MRLLRSGQSCTHSLPSCHGARVATGSVEGKVHWICAVNVLRPSSDGERGQFRHARMVNRVTSNSALKRAARDYSRQHGVSYRDAIRVVDRRTDDRFHYLATRVLIEAIEGCGIRHWAGVEAWDGWSHATITDLGGESFDLDHGTIAPALAAYLRENPESDAREIDGYLADEFVQSGLFGLIIYRSEVTHRPRTIHVNRHEPCGRLTDALPPTSASPSTWSREHASGVPPTS